MEMGIKIIRRGRGEVGGVILKLLMIVLLSLRKRKRKMGRDLLLLRRS
jgi:hypothetical protein